MYKINYCERFEPRTHFKSRLSLIVRVNIVLNRTVVVHRDYVHTDDQTQPTFKINDICNFLNHIVMPICHSELGRQQQKHIVSNKNVHQ